MVDADTFIDLAKSFEESVEQPHFEKQSYRVNKKIFATLDTTSNIAVLKLTPAQQAEYCEMNENSMYPVKGHWGRMGYTCFELNNLGRDLVLAAVTRSYCNVAPKKLSEKYRRLHK